MQRRRPIPNRNTKIKRRRPCSVDDAELGHFMLLFCKYGIEMYIDLERTCTAVGLLIKPFFGDVLFAVVVVFCLINLPNVYKCELGKVTRLTIHWRDTTHA